MPCLFWEADVPFASFCVISFVGPIAERIFILPVRCCPLRLSFILPRGGALVKLSTRRFAQVDLVDVGVCLHRLCERMVRPRAFVSFAELCPILIDVTL